MRIYISFTKFHEILLSGFRVVALTIKRPMGHIAHLRKQFKSINTYDYVTFLNKFLRYVTNVINITVYPEKC